MNQKSDDRKSLKHPYKRKCCDCGKPTNNYRCHECWEKMKKEDNLDFNSLDLDTIYFYDEDIE